MNLIIEMWSSILVLEVEEDRVEVSWKLLHFEQGEVEEDGLVVVVLLLGRCSWGEFASLVLEVFVYLW